MEKTRKNLKEYSIVVLAFIALTVIKAIVGICINGLPQTNEIPEGMTRELAQMITTIAFALSFVSLIPQIYVGVKGLKIANNPETSVKAYLVWTAILTVCAAIATISAISELIKAFSVGGLFNLMYPAVDVLLFACCYTSARKIANA